MIRPLKNTDFAAAIAIVNDNWQKVYAGYVNPALLSPFGCQARAERLTEDFKRQRLDNYVWDDSGHVLGLLSIGATADKDKPHAFEIWRIYVAQEAQGQGIGTHLLAFAEQFAQSNDYHEMIIWAFCQNSRAITFYQKHGYRIDQTRDLGEPYQAEGMRLFKLL